MCPAPGDPACNPQLASSTAGQPAGYRNPWVIKIDARYGKKKFHFYELLALLLHRRLTNPTLDCSAAPENPVRVEAEKELSMRRLISKFLADESGATAIEYCLIASGISIVIFVAVNSIGTQLNTKFAAVNNSLK
jgi:pilus assembly protein Flp/PilA